MNKTTYLFEDGFDADFDAAPVAKVADPDAIKQQRAHIANGGEGTQTFACPACRGRGRFVSYAGRDCGPCFKCKGTAKISKGQNAAIKGKATKEANRLAWHEKYHDMITALAKVAEWNDFAKKMLQAMGEYGTLTDNQVAACERMLAKLAANAAAKKEARIAAAPVIEISAIEKLFAKAVDNDVKRPIFRADGLEISKAPATGKNPNALYVKAGGEYAGKIVGGKFHKAFNAPADTAERLMAVAADPLAEAMKYGRRTGNCALCGRDLVDPVSIRALVGPICAPKWGLEWRRDAAAEELNEEAAAEAAKEGGVK